MFVVTSQPTALFHPILIRSPAEGLLQSLQEHEKTKDTEPNKKETAEPKVVRFHRESVHVIKQENSWMVCVDVPGVKPDAVEIVENKVDFNTGIDHQSVVANANEL